MNSFLFCKLYMIYYFTPGLYMTLSFPNISCSTIILWSMSEIVSVLLLFISSPNNEGFNMVYSNILDMNTSL